MKIFIGIIIGISLCIVVYFIYSNIVEDKINLSNSHPFSTNPIANTKWQSETGVTLEFGQTSYSFIGVNKGSGNYRITGDTIFFSGTEWWSVSVKEMEGALIGDTITAFKIKFKRVQ
jgi:hypothetical protein